MLVLAAVHGSLIARLEYAARDRFRFVPVRTWEDALSAILSKPLELGVLDPALDGTARSQEIERLKVLFPSFPLILYTQLSPAVAPVLLRLGQIGIRQIVIARHDDHPARLTELLSGEASHAVAGQLMNALSDLLVGCPGELKWAIETAIREPAAVQSVQDLAIRARMDRRTCLRWFAKANLPPPSVTLMVLRVIYAHRLLQDPGYTVEDVATKLGYAQTRSLAQNVKEVLGMTPGELRVSLTPEDALQRVRERYFSPALSTRHLARVS
jgi:AraC-like DNA-binding protein